VNRMKRVKHRRNSWIGKKLEVGKGFDFPWEFRVRSDDSRLRIRYQIAARRWLDRIDRIDCLNR